MLSNNNTSSAHTRRTLALGIILAIFYAIIITTASLPAGPTGGSTRMRDADYSVPVLQDTHDAAQALAVVYSIISYNDISYYINEETATGALKLVVFHRK